MVMNKKELIKKVARCSHTPLAVCEKVLNSFSDVVVDVLSSGDYLFWKDFVRIETYDRKPIRRRDPVNGGVTVFPAARAVRCVFGKRVKDGIKSEENKE